LSPRGAHVSESAASLRGFGAGHASCPAPPMSLRWSPISWSLVCLVGVPQALAEVQCGGHTAVNCAACPQGHGASWCNGDCMWEHNPGRCIEIPFGNQDLYELLELSDNASPSDIKQAYRRLSLVYHPDKNPNADAQRFRAIRDAYEVLSTPEKKVLYDTGGMQAVKKGESGNAEKGQGIERSVELPMEAFYHGIKRKVPVRRRVICRRCKSHPDKQRCKGCSECPPVTEIIHIRHGGMLFPQRRERPSNEVCRQAIIELEVMVEPGAFPGERVTFGNMGSQTPGEIPGDVTVVLKVQQDERGWRRSGNDLVLALNLTVREALLGFERSIPHLGGGTVELSTKSVTRPGQAIRIKGMGMPVKGSHTDFGDLHVIANVAFPKAITPEQRAELEGVRALSELLVPPSRRDEL